MSWVIVVTHTSGDPTVFGPFATRDDAETWLTGNMGALGPNPVNISIIEQIPAAMEMKRR